MVDCSIVLLLVGRKTKYKYNLMIPNNGLNLMLMHCWRTGKMSLWTCCLCCWCGHSWNIFSCAIEHLVSRVFMPNECLSVWWHWNAFSSYNIQLINFLWTISSFEIAVVWSSGFQTVEAYSRAGLVWFFCQFLQDFFGGTVEY